MTNTAAPRPVGLRVWRIEVTREGSDELRILAVAGRLGTAASGELLQAAVEEMRAGHRRILIDLEGVDYASSAGLAALQGAARYAQECSATLVLCGLTPPVRLVFDLARLLPHLAVEGSRDDGIARLREHG